MISSPIPSALESEGFCRYRMKAGLALHSSSLSALDLNGDYGAFRIECGEVFLHHGVAWRSLLMGTHGLLVFLGLSSLGKSSLNFQYGEPWCYKASLIRHLLVENRAITPVSRRQAATVFTEELRLVRFPLARAMGFLAGVLLPRRGWKVP